MAHSVREIMNPELLSVRGDTPSDETLDMILEFGVTAVPVLDHDGRPLGVTSLRDLVRLGPARAPITSPATTVALHASVATVAETMAVTGRHHLVVVGGDGRAVGMVSTLDVIRALLGKPTNHPATFPRGDPEFGGAWSNDEVFDETGVLATPPEPGVIVLVCGGVNHREERVWAGTTTNLRRHARELLDGNAFGSPVLKAALGKPNLRLRWSVLQRETAREALAKRINDRIANAPPPGGT